MHKCPLPPPPPPPPPASSATPTSILEVLDEEAKALSPRDEVVLENRQTSGLGKLHTDLVLLLRESSALSKETELGRGKREREGGREGRREGGREGGREELRKKHK